MSGFDFVNEAVSAAAGAGMTSVQANADGDLRRVDPSGNDYPISEAYVHIDMTDVSTASSSWAPAPCAGVITRIQTILHNAITVADANLTFEVNGTALNGFAIVVATAGSAAGDYDTDTPTAGHASTAVAVGDKLELISDGGSTTAARLTCIVTIAKRAL